MTDPGTLTALAVSARSPAALGTVFLAGLVTSAGPCMAPRYVAITALANRDRRPLVPTLAFVAGMLGALVALGFAAGLLGTLWSWSPAVHEVLAAGLIAGGAVALVRAVPHDHRDDRCSHCRPASGRPRSIGAVFLLGAGSAFVVSPCCTPIVAATAAASMAVGAPFAGVLLLLAYGAGHAAPLLLAGTVGPAVSRLVPEAWHGQPAAIVSAVLMLALGAYYGVLA